MTGLKTLGETHKDQNFTIYIIKRVRGDGRGAPALLRLGPSSQRQGKQTRVVYALLAEGHELVPHEAAFNHPPLSLWRKIREKCKMK